MAPTKARKTKTSRTGESRKPRLPKDVAAAVTAVCDKKAEDVVVLDLRKTGGFTDYFVICTGANARQMTAIADSVLDTLRQSLDERPALAEGVDKSEWILLDYFNFVVHIFSRECRAFYGLERLWGNAERHEITTRSADVRRRCAHGGGSRAAMRGVRHTPSNSRHAAPSATSCWTGVDLMRPPLARLVDDSVIDVSRSAGLYEGALRDIIHAFKYRWAANARGQVGRQDARGWQRSARRMPTALCPSRSIRGEDLREDSISQRIWLLISICPSSTHSGEREPRRRKRA